MHLYLPIVYQGDQLEEFYGKVTRLQRTDHVDLVNLQFYQYDVEFLAYMDEENIHYMSEYFNPESHYRIIAQPLRDKEYLILAMENSEFSLDSELLIERYSEVRWYFLICAGGLFLVLGHLFYMEFRFYRSVFGRE